MIPWRMVIAIGAAAGAFLYAPHALPQQKKVPPTYKPDPSEAVQTPEFCWGQFLGKKGPQYEISKPLCGALMNHYCPGLIALQRANRNFGNKGQRIQYLQRARADAQYTLDGMKTFPNCPIRSHVETTLRIVEPQLRALGAK